MPNPDRETLPAEIRRERMVAYIAERQFARVADLAEAFGISDVTVRSDLDALHEARAVRRVRGGAVAQRVARGPRTQVDDVAPVPATEDRERIGVVAASRVSSGMSVLLGSGATATAVARALAARSDLHDVVVVTNGLDVALELGAARPRITVVVTGGTLHPTRNTLVEPMAGTLLADIRVDLAIVGCGGVEAGHGVTYADLSEAGVAQRMIDSAARALVVADGSKVGQVHLGRVAPTARLTTLVTSPGADARALEDLRTAGVDVVVAGP